MEANFTLNSTVEKVAKTVRLPEWLSNPARESHQSWALGFSLVMMSLILWMILWQADLISYHRELIRWLWYVAGR